jgi:hypothetical protein
VVACCLFVIVGIANELLLGEGSGAEKGEAGGQCAVGEAHGYGDGGKASLGREDLGVVARGAGGVADLAGRVAPSGVDDGVELIALDRLGESVAEGDLGRVVVDAGAGAAAVECAVRIGLGRRDCTVDLTADVRKVAAGVHDGLSEW